MGDGCNQEGIASEACSLAGHLKLGKLIALYDDNQITIDGRTDVSFTEDVLRRYEAYGWHVQHVQNGNTDVNAVIKDYNSGSPQTLTAGAWATAGTFTRGTSTLKMTGAGKSLNYLSDFVLVAPETHKYVFPITSSIILQILAYELAVCRDCEIDQPRNLAKSVTVE